MSPLYDSPFGVLTLRATDKGLAALSFHPRADGGGDPAILRAAAGCVVEGEIPAAQVHELRRQLPGLTRGEGVLESEFSRYRAS